MKKAALRVWGWPTAIALTSTVGLVAALVDDGAWDAIGWIALAIPVALGTWGCVRAFGRRRA